jgi:hypothetical protein
MEILYNWEFLFTDFHGLYEMVAQHWRETVLGFDCRSINDQNRFRSE